ncbi:MAG: serine protease [Bacteriovoracaceae bacterium]
MKLLATSLLLLGSQIALSATDVVYGVDNRKDVYETSNPLHLKLVKSTAGRIPVRSFVKNLNGLLKIGSSATLESDMNVCSTVQYADQPVVADYSGFLVGPDILVTAGHCYIGESGSPEDSCKKYAWVFDYALNSAGQNPIENISPSNVYNCKQVIKAQRDKFLDYAVIKLDRKVEGREPLKFRTSGKISVTTPLVVIGHPTGLPSKISDGGKVTYNSELTRFSTNLDTFAGNSGSAVFDSKTGLLEGILIMGKTDYIPSDLNDPTSCQIINTCDENGNNCVAGQEEFPVDHGEVVLRISNITSVLQNALKEEI